MSRWLDRVDGLLFEGETVEDAVEFGDAEGRGVVVTSHRVLAFTPEADGANYRAVDRPNVDGVDRVAGGRLVVLLQAVEAGVAGVVLLVAGSVLSLDGLVAGIDLTSGTGELGLGGLLGTLQTLLTLLALLDDLLRAAGALALLAAVALAGAYWYTREESLVVRVAGDDDVDVPAPEREGVAERVERAVRPGPSGVESEGDASIGARAGPTAESDTAPTRSPAGDGESVDGPRDRDPLA